MDIKLSADDLASIMFARRQLGPDWTFIARSHTRAWIGPNRTGVVVDYFHGEVRLQLSRRRSVTLAAQGDKPWTATEVVALAIHYGLLATR